MRDFIKKNKIGVKVRNDITEKEHFHQDIELIYVLEGQMKLTLLEKEYRLRHKDILVINSNERHSYVNTEDILFAQVHISYNLVQQVYNGISSVFFCNSSAEESEKYAEKYAELRKILNQLLRSLMLYEQDKDLKKQYDYEYISQFFHLLGYLTSHFLIRTASDETMSVQLKSQQRMMQISDYIEGNYAQPICLQTLSEYLYLSEGYLSRYFKKVYNMSFTDYLKQVRLSHAMEQLMYTDIPITKIALDNGFSSVSFFNRVFKKEYGSSPSSFRNTAQAKLEKMEEQTDSFVINERLEHFFCMEEQDEKAKNRVRNVKESYSVANSRKVNPIWNQVINIGRASDILNHEMQEHIVQLKQSLNFQYLRFWNILSEDMLISSAGEPGKYNFVRLDQVLDFILSTGLKPFIDLEEKPKRINKTSMSVLLYEEKKVIFATVMEWEQFITALMQHWVRRYGMEELSSWKLEIWFDGYRIADGDPVNSFFSIFKSTYSIIKKYVPDMEIGGCGIFPEFIQEMGLRKLNIWEEWHRKAPKPDFFSMINFSYDMDADGKESFGKKSEDQEYLLHSVQKIKKEMSASGFPDVKLYITEWNLTVSDRNKMNDSCFQGAYIIKNIIDIYDQVDLIGYFAGSDLYSEYYDSFRLLYGGQGLLTRDGITKPSGFAFRFLNKLYPYFVNKSDNFLITTDRRDKYSIVCHNMKQLNYYYYLTEEDQYEGGKLWKNFEDLNPLVLDIILNDVTNGTYQVKIQKVNEKSGSVQDIWKDMEFCDDLSRNDVNYLKRVCAPRMIIRKCPVENRHIAIQVKMKPNEIAHIRVERIE